MLENIIIKAKIYFTGILKILSVSKMQFIYVLELQQGKYYVGKTNDLSKRMNDHIAGIGAQWTKTYSFVSLAFAKTMTHQFEEDNIVKEWMIKKGIDNVRGGSYCQAILSDEQKALLTRELYGAQDLCQGCGKSGHMIKQCPSKSVSSPIVKAENTSSKAVSSPVAKSKEEPSILGILAQVVCDMIEPKKAKTPCGRCGRLSHNAKSCYAKTDVNGAPL